MKVETKKILREMVIDLKEVQVCEFKDKDLVVFVAANFLPKNEIIILADAINEVFRQIEGVNYLLVQGSLLNVLDMKGFCEFLRDNMSHEYLLILKESLKDIT